jgi:hypothetical protein
MPSSEAVELKLGEGRISGAISIFLASLGVVGKPLPRGFLAQHLYPFIAPPKPQRKMPGGNDA